MKFFTKVLTIGLCIILAMAVVIGAYAIWDQQNLYKEAAPNGKTVLGETAQEQTNETEENAGQEENQKGSSMQAAATKSTNQQVIDAQKINSEVVGWITLSGTGIDYGIAQGTNDSKYINTGIDGEYSAAGAIYLSYKNAKDFSDFNNVIYGHNMEQGRMFGDLKKYKDGTFFENNKTGKLLLSDTSYDVEVMAFLETDASNTKIINSKVVDKAKWIQDVKEIAIQYRDLNQSTEDTYLTLVTCKDTTTKRSVLILRIAGKTSGETTTPDPEPSTPTIPTTATGIEFEAPTVKKTINGTKPSTDATFSFTLAADETSYPMPSGSSNGKKTVSRKGEGTVDFGKIKFTTPGMYSYTITEVKGSTAGYTYDDRVYVLKVAIINDGNGGYEASWTLQAKGSDGKTDVATFDNTYKETGSTPTPVQPTPNVPNTPDTPDNPDNPDNPDDSDDPINPTNPDNPDDSGTPNEPNNSADTPSQDETPQAPKTADLTDYTPLLILFLFIAFPVILMWVRMRKIKKGA